MKKILILFLLLTSLGLYSSAQDSGMYFGPKGGATVAVQNWGGYDRNPLLASHVAIFTESLDYDFRGCVYAQLGYHTRGSSIRTFTFNGSSFTNGFRFNNLALQLGLKKRFDRPGKYLPYYMVGVRLEYTVNSNLSNFENSANLFYPFDVYINKWNYGISFGGGLEYEINEFIIPFIELSFHPDLSLQYRSPPLTGGSSPWTGQPTSISERRIRNITMEITFGFKFLRKVTYID